MSGPAVKITSRSELDRLLQNSDATTLLLFKHSATCPISAGAMAQFEELLQTREADKDDSFTPAYLVVQESRDLSTEVSKRLQVRHESPQAILIKQGRAQWHASHGAVTVQALRQALGQHAGTG
ncbi:MAG: bacillithiol system redox-active protein YtxJ [Thermaerobacterales bacterium]